MKRGVASYLIYMNPLSKTTSKQKVEGIIIFEIKKILYGMLAQKLCHDVNFPIFHMAIKISC